MPDISALNQFKADMYPCSYKALLVGGNIKKKREKIACGEVKTAIKLANYPQLMCDHIFSVQFVCGSFHRPRNKQAD